MIRLRLLIAVLSVALVLPVSAAPAAPPIDSAAQWVRSGQATQLPIVQYGSETYVSVDNAAQIADAQVRWQAAAQKVTLTNGSGELSLDWGRRVVERNGKKVRGSVALRYENDRLLVPISFLISKDFATFADADIAWDAKKSLLSHNPHVNLRMPEVETEDGVYRISLDVNPLAPPQLIQQDRDQIWLRFSRATTDGTQIYEGDSVISEVRVNQKRHSADFIVKLGDNVRDSDVYFDDGRRRLVIEVRPDHDVAQRPDPAPEPKALTAAPAPAAHPVPIAKAPAPSPIPVKAASAKKSEKKIEKKLPIVAARPESPIDVVPAKPSVERRQATVPTGKNSERIIVVDAGHGGIDCGAIGARGTLEKDINLEVARLLASELRKIKGVRVVMTRDKDVFIPLSQRTTVANNANATLFVSVHCNSSLSSKGRGFEAYFLSPDATDRAAAAVARVENSVVSLEAHKGASSSKLEELLASMAVYNTLNESSRFAGHVSRNVKNRSNVESATVKEANFYVLRGAQMPSVLLELEYLSNPVSELQLRSSRFRQQLVKGIVDGINGYDKSVRQEREAYAAQLRRESGRTR